MKHILTTVVVLGTALTMRAQLIAVNTEGTSDLLMAPNVGVELVTGNRSSISVNALMTRGLLVAKDVKLTAVQPEYRYWFSGRPIHKWFVGVGGIYANYDIRWAGKVYDGYGFGGGLTYGYVINITDRLNIDIHSGIGIIYYKRKEYFEHDNFDTDYAQDGAQRPNAQGYYILPTRIGVSVSYILR